MTFRRLAAIALILVGTSAAWTVLGSSLVARGGEFDSRLGSAVQLFWGGPQVAPDAWLLLRGDVSKEMPAVVNVVPGAVITLNVQYRSVHVSWDAIFRAGTTSSTWESGHARRD